VSVARDDGPVRVTRLISAVLLLQARGPMTAAQLAGELEVSERTVYRDMVALSAAGIPIYAEQGRAGGYRLLDGYRTRLTGLSRDEAEALFLAGLPGPARDMGLAEAVATARLKVLAALPPGLRDASDSAARRFHLDAPGWFDATAPPPLLVDLARAVWQDRVVHLRYGRATVARPVEPYGLVLKNSVWYLVGRGDDLRVYRVDRATGVEVTDTPFVRADSFDLAVFWAERAAEFVRGLHREEVTVRLSAAGLRELRFATDPMIARQVTEDAGEPDGQGTVTVRLPVESVDVAHTQLRRLGAEVEVLEPPALRTLMADTARRLYAIYGDDPGDAQR
jgi:predicted DNA-binding transcriptional regulator YafY